MRFYTKQHKFYCGIDLHANKMYLCILDETGEVRLHRNLITDREVFLKAIHPFREDIIVAVECMFTWYQSSLKLRLDRLGRRSLCRGRDPLCPGSCPLHESHPWRQSKK
jgi:hypothetical protein